MLLFFLFFSLPIQGRVWGVRCCVGAWLYTTCMELQKVRVAQFKKPFTLYSRNISQVCSEVPYLRC